MNFDRSRRGFIGGAIGAAAVSRAAMAQVGALGKTGETKVGAAALSADDAAYFAAEEPFFKEFASEFLLDPNIVYFMAAQKGSMPKPVLARFKEGLDHVARDPFPVYVEPSVKIRETIARCYGTTKDQIAITRNTTDALTLSLMGLEWSPGDELLISPLEHPTGITLALRLAARYGVVIKQGACRPGRMRRSTRSSPRSNAAWCRARPNASSSPRRYGPMASVCPSGGSPRWRRRSAPSP